MTSIIMILAAFVCACMAETPTASGSEIGYAMESFAGSSYPELVQSIAECAADDDCDFEAALAAYPIPDAEYVESLDAEYVESLFPAIDEEGEVPAFEGEVPAFEDLQVPAFEDLQVPAFEEGEMPAFGEAVDSAEDSADGRRQLAGLPDRYGWANGRTYRCANEGGWCPCFGNVVYTKKCSGTFSCNQASWGRVVSNRWNSNHRANVNGWVRCNNANMGGDPFPGHDKQCFCHPRNNWWSSFFGRRQLAIDEEAEVPAVPAVVEAVMPAEDNAVNRRLLAGLPDRYGWANGETHRCANEGGWCACDGNVVYTKKCAGTFSCNRASWGRVVSERWNSNHKANVNGGVRCNNGNFGGDPFPGHDKQCFCHPVQQQPTQYDYVQKWTERRCNQQCGSPGASWFSSDWWKGVLCGFSCTGACPIQAAAFAAGREHTFPIESCAEHCYCVFKGWTA